LDVLAPGNFQKLYGFPVTVEVELGEEAEASTFQAWLNDRDVTAAFKKYGHGMKAVFYLEDGLRYAKSDEKAKTPNILQTKVASSSPGKGVNFKTYFFLRLGTLTAIGPEGGTVKSRDGRMQLDIPTNALSSTTRIALSKRPNRINNQPIYQISSRRTYLKRPMSISLTYEPADLPQDVRKEDLLMMWDGDFLTRLPTEETRAERLVRVGPVPFLTRAQVFLSHYVSTESKLSDIPNANGVTLPIGDDGDAPYDCGNVGEVKTDHTAHSPNRLIWKSCPNSNQPKISLKTGKAECRWQTRTVFAQREMEGVFSTGEEWEFACRQNAPPVLPVRAIADGLVVYNQGEPGDAIVLAHRMNGVPFLSIYTNRVERSPCPVRSLVKRGDVIAKIGRTGIDPALLHVAIGRQSLLRVEEETGRVKIPAVWFRHWTQEDVRSKYYNPTTFLLHLTGKYRWDFDCDGNDEGWIVENTKPYEEGNRFRVKNGMLTFKPRKGPSPGSVQLISYPLDLEAAVFDSLFITMQATHPIKRGAVYFATSETPDFSKARAVPFDIVEDDFHEYKVFLADNEEWTGTISGIRVEFVTPTTDSDSEIQIDSIRFGRGFLSKIPDTGQILCYDADHSIPCPEPGEPFYGQDANYQIHRPDYETGDIEGTDVIIDTVTGLTWQKEPDGVPRNWLEAIDAIPTGKDSEWRLPTRKELQTLLYYGQAPSGICIDSAYFATVSDPPWMNWSATTEAFLSKDAWTVSFGDCRVDYVSKDEVNYLLPVMGRRLEFARFKDNGDHTVTDLSTGLMWYRRETAAMGWKEALAFCEGLAAAGHTDWRLPNMKELQTIVNDGTQSPAIDRVYFPGCRPLIYWSSTTNAKHPEFAWYVDFDDGHVYGSGLKTREYYVRAVRTVY
jgi:hypothetical protein